LIDRTGRKPWTKTRRFTPGDKEQTLGKNKKIHTRRQGENLGQKQEEITPSDKEKTLGKNKK
jgi:hypothetical protein